MQTLIGVAAHSHIHQAGKAAGSGSGSVTLLTNTIFGGGGCI
jgi:hypothetical protein